MIGISAMKKSLKSILLETLIFIGFAMITYKHLTNFHAFYLSKYVTSALFYDQISFTFIHFEAFWSS